MVDVPHHVFQISRRWIVPQRCTGFLLDRGRPANACAQRSDGTQAQPLARQAPGCQLSGSNSSIRLLSCVGSRVSTSFRYAKGSCPHSLADCSRLITTAARSPASWLPRNNQFLRPSAQGLIWFSIWLLSTGTAPSVKKSESACQWFKL